MPFREPTMPARRVVVGGTHSGVGKTTVTLALLAALCRRGLRVQPFKVGPDFIDAGHHAAVCGRPAYNLDTWMVPDDRVRTTFARAGAGADVAVIEGVMGLFDGRSADDPRGSTAHLARLLDCPVVLVVDASGVAASVAAVVKGFCDFDPEVRVAGVICNRVAGERHYAYLEPAIRRHTRVAPLGWLPRCPDWEIPQRHLGLTTAEDVRAAGDSSWQCRIEQLGEALEKTIHVDDLLAVSQRRVAWAESSPPVATGGFPAPATHGSGAKVAVACDAAFCFYYQENLDLLREAGADLVSFSPLSDASLPDGTDLVYLGGGYPELHAERLAANRSLLASLRAYHASGGRIYAECGGLMYCCRELTDGAGRVFPLLDLLPARAVMQPRLAALGYVGWRASKDSLLGPAGTEWRGHEFHYSRLEALGPLYPVALLHREGGEPKADGFANGGLLAGYAHLHFASHTDGVARLLVP
jgi:cobyrinic acid a,c-diamide synthase